MSISHPYTRPVEVALSRPQRGSAMRGRVGLRDINQSGSGDSRLYNSGTAVLGAPDRSAVIWRAADEDRQTLTFGSESSAKRRRLSTSSTPACCEQRRVGYRPELCPLPSGRCWPGTQEASIEWSFRGYDVPAHRDAPGPESSQAVRPNSASSSTKVTLDSSAKAAAPEGSLSVARHGKHKARLMSRTSFTYDLTGFYIKGVKRTQHEPRHAQAHRHLRNACLSSSYTLPELRLRSFSPILDCAHSTATRTRAEEEAAASRGDHAESAPTL